MIPYPGEDLSQKKQERRREKERRTGRESPKKEIAPARTNYQPHVPITLHHVFNIATFRLFELLPSDHHSMTETETETLVLKTGQVVIRTGQERANPETERQLQLTIHTVSD